MLANSAKPANVPWYIGLCRPKRSAIFTLTGLNAMVVKVIQRIFLFVFSQHFGRSNAATFSNRISVSSEFPVFAVLCSE